MKHTITIFENFLQEKGFYNERTLELFIKFLENNKESRIDKKEKQFIKAVIIGFLAIHSERMLRKAIEDGITFF